MATKTSNRRRKYICTECGAETFKPPNTKSNVITSICSGKCDGNTIHKKKEHECPGTGTCEFCD